MDEKDIRILNAIAEIESGSAEKISKETNIPKSTVHYRLDNLQTKNVITNDLFDLNMEKLGLNITVITEVWADYDQGYHNEVGERLSEVEGVNQVYFTMGDTDFVVISRLSNRNMVERIVEQFEAIEEINRTSSKFAIKTIKDENRPLNDFDIELLLDNLEPLQD
ncbi:Lrp/AsnC family transcriptional regulator [Natrinema sp. 1APR25-10V2]|uniref:Lrp/AsnC family transcriptional regulator n=1 Tax=Natrinema sp. 1APR25-10V2 TaxID=2951081 RepID=UPI0028745BBC|nr:Lrp/AsnC family transcriptional regulator [Natrinema sp. 1APR25-10V2]MDS0477112.1 Lrp/AsnC family transcriptional regulator [Natrinema sp. 1APR25-10V2]